MSKVQYEYVYVEEFPIIISDLKRSSDSLQVMINAAIDAANLHEEKHANLESARAIFEELTKDLTKLKAFLPIREELKPKPERIRAPKIEKKLPEKEFLAKSQFALKNLQQNLADLKEELRKLR